MSIARQHRLASVASMFAFILYVYLTSDKWVACSVSVERFRP